MKRNDKTKKYKLLQYIHDCTAKKLYILLLSCCIMYLGYFCSLDPHVKTHKNDRKRQVYSPSNRLFGVSPKIIRAHDVNTAFIGRSAAQ